MVKVFLNSETSVELSTQEYGDVLNYVVDTTVINTKMYTY